MVLQRPPFAGLLLLSAIASSLGAIFCLNRRETPGAVPLAVIMVSAALWAVAYTFQLATVTRGAKLFWWQVKYIGIAPIATAFLLFVFEYTGRPDWVTRRTVGLLSIGPLTNLALVWTNHDHHLYVDHATLETAVGLVMLDTPIGAGFWAVVAYNYLLLLAGAVLVLRMFAASDRPFRSQTAAMLLGLSAPWLANVLFVLEFRPAGIDITPLAFIVTGMAFLWAVFRHELLEIVPIPKALARETLLETITDATVVVDENGRVVDINPAGRKMVAREVTAPIGEPFHRVFPELEGMFEADQPAEAALDDVEISRPTGTGYYDVQVSPLRGSRKFRGHIVILRDITDRARHRQRLEVMNRVLRHDIRNDVNVILAHADEVLAGAEDYERRVARIKDIAFEVVRLSDQARTMEETMGTEDVLERFDMVAFLERYLEQVRQDFPSIEITQDLPDQADVTAHPLIGSAIKNVIENAVEHNTHAAPAVEVSITNRTAEGDIVLRVVDNGPGIPAEEREVIQRGTETQIRHSSGLGLWLTNWIITESGGDIRFEENDPQGTRLTIRLPAAEPDDPERGVTAG